MPPRRVLVSFACLAVLASGCSSGGSTPGASAPTGSPEVPASRAAAGTPRRAALTARGSKLSFGDSATVAFAPTSRAKARLRLTVMGARRASRQDFAGFVLNDAYQRTATFYYVKVRVANAGGADVGGTAVPLWGVDAKNRLLPVVSFASRFSRCPSTALPKKFTAGDSVSTCLVYLSPHHGALDAVSFRPSQAFNPITWTGPIGAAKVTPTKKPSKKSTKRKQPR